MTNTKYVLQYIKIEGAVRELLVKTNAENTTVTWNGAETTLASALANIFANFTNLPTAEQVDSKISAAIGELVNGAPETGDTLKELFDLISTNSDAMDLLNAAIGEKASAADLTDAIARIAALEGNSHSHENKSVLDSITAEQVGRWNGIRGVRYGTEVPDDMQNGELFVRVINEA